MMQNTTPDQTQFVTESPLLEKVNGGPEQVLSEEELKLLKQKKNKKIIIISVAFLLIVLGIFFLTKLRPAKEIGPAIEEEEVVLTKVVVGPFNQRLLELKSELEAADPNQEELPFPPIDREISLEE